MTKLIANEQIWVGFVTKATGITQEPPLAIQVDDGDITGATVLTSYLVTLDASTRGNVVPTPSLDTTFETSISGTVNATFMAEFYRDDTTDTAWTTLPRGTQGYFIISRMDPSPTSGESTPVEVWPVIVTARSANPLTSNDSQRFTVECSVWAVPDEDVAVQAS